MSKQNKVTAEWDAMAGEWDDMAHSYRDGLIKILWNEILPQEYKTKESRQDLIVLDFGCGTGLLTEIIRHDVKQIIAIDVAPTMIQILNDKIRAGNWNNVTAYCGVLAETNTTDNSSDNNNNNNNNLQTIIKSLEGQVDIIIASSVFNFIPQDDLEITMKILCKLLKSKTGILCHTDWPKGDEHPDGFDKEKAFNMYKMAVGDDDDDDEILQPKTTQITSLKMGSQEIPVFVGVAIKK